LVIFSGKVRKNVIIFEAPSDGILHSFDSVQIITLLAAHQTGSAVQAGLLDFADAVVG